MRDVLRLPSDRSVVHIAGVPVEIRGELRQLCAWCGVDLHAEPNRNGRLALIQIHGLVRIARQSDGTGVTGVIGMYKIGEQLPPDVCYYLAPENQDR